MSDIIYTFKNNAYFNITNRCTCKCIFCIRNEHEAIGEARLFFRNKKRFGIFLSALFRSGV